VKKHLRNINYILEGSKTIVAFKSTHTEKVSISSQMAVIMIQVQARYSITILINNCLKKSLEEKVNLNKRIANLMVLGFAIQFCCTCLLFRMF